MTAIEEKEMCECANWARAVNLEYLTDHHPSCPHYNDSLMDVWKVTDGSSSYYHEHEANALQDKQADEECGVTNLVISKEKMHREVFEHLLEFEGF